MNDLQQNIKMPDNYITFRNNLLEYLNIEKVYDFIGQTNHTEGKKCDFIIHRRKLPVVEVINYNIKSKKQNVKCFVRTYDL